MQVFTKSFVIAMVFLFPGVALSAPVNDVLRACDNMKSRGENCDYSIAKDGEISGCTPTICFICPADGSRECHQAMVGGKGKPVVSGADNLLQVLQAPASPSMKTPPKIQPGKTAKP
jgi:hypothetical protein